MQFIIKKIVCLTLVPSLEMTAFCRKYFFIPSSIIFSLSTIFPSLRKYHTCIYHSIDSSMLYKKMYKNSQILMFVFSKIFQYFFPFPAFLTNPSFSSLSMSPCAIFTSIPSLLARLGAMTRLDSVAAINALLHRHVV